MLHTQTVDGLYALKLDAMAQGLADQQESAEYQALSFEERLGLLVDRELTERENRRRQRYLMLAKLRSDAIIEDVDFRRQRGLDRAQVLGLAECAWVRNHHHLGIVGATGTGKTFLACALANAAIRRGHNALYLRFPRMLDEFGHCPGGRTLRPTHRRLGLHRRLGDRRFRPAAALRRPGRRHLGGH
jgi:DNA replication protein DnaC